MLQEQGHEVEVACYLDVPLEGLPVIWEIPFSRTPYRLVNVRAYCELRRLLQKRKYDLVHVHTPVAAFLTRFAARGLGIPVLYTAHGFHFYRGAPLWNWLFYYTAEKIASRWTAGLVVMNGEDFGSGKRLGFTEGENLFFVRGVGVDLGRFTPASERGEKVREELGLGPEDAVAACVAEFTPTKNHEFLLSAWRRVAREIPRAYLLLVGDGTLRPGLEEGARRAGIPRVRFLGYREDVPEVLAAADVFVLASRREGLPRAVMEAMAAGKPIVVTNVRGSRDLVAHGETGYLVSLGDEKALATALTKLLEDCDLARRMGEAGRKRIAPYALENVLAEMQMVYSRFLKLRS